MFQQDRLAGQVTRFRTAFGLFARIHLALLGFPRPHLNISTLNILAINGIYAAAQQAHSPGAPCLVHKTDMSYSIRQAPHFPGIWIL
jgi:hypothetical protein